MHYVSADTNVTADAGTLNDVTHDLFLQGNVHVTQGPRTVLADTVHYNTVTVERMPKVPVKPALR